MNIVQWKITTTILNQIRIVVNGNQASVEDKRMYNRGRCFGETLEKTIQYL